MEPQVASAEVTFYQHHDDTEFKRRIRKTTILLSVITIIELALGLTVYFIHREASVHIMLVHMFRGVICILSLAKAFYIVSIFMHLGDEIRNMIMTVVVPLLLFIWFVLAFLIDGGSYNSLRNNYDPYYKQTTTQPANNQTTPPAEKSGKD
jgi:hypothetical protein